MEEKKKITIVTHNSKFHTDDIFAVAVLKLLLEKDHEITIIRTRDKKIIEAAGYVVDVGGEYDSVRNRFDHHQEGKAGARLNGIQYSSIGLVWKKYGEQICGSKEIADAIDEILIQPVDAHDNGIQFIKTNIEGVYPYDIGSFFHAFVPTWKEGTEDIDVIFLRCVSVAEELLGREIVRYTDNFEARDIINEIYLHTEDKRLIVFDLYYSVGEFISKFSEPLFYVFPSSDNTWILKTVRNNSEEFIDRKSLPKSWAGKRDEELEKVTGVQGSIFSHNNRFFAVAQTKQAILQLAEIALNTQD